MTLNIIKLASLRSLSSIHDTYWGSLSSRNVLIMFTIHYLNETIIIHDPNFSSLVTGITKISQN